MFFVSFGQEGARERVVHKIGRPFALATDTGGHVDRLENHALVARLARDVATVGTLETGFLGGRTDLAFPSFFSFHSWFDSVHFLQPF